MKLAFTALVLCVATLATSSLARADDKDKEKAWTVTAAPYVWLPSVNGNLSFTGPAGNSSNVNVAVNPGCYLNTLNSAFAFAGELRKGGLAVFTDLLYVNASTSTAAVTSVTGPAGFVTIPVTLSTQQRSNQIIWTLAPSLTVLKTPRSSLEVFTGFRYAAVNAAVGWQFTAPITPAGVGIAGNLMQNRTIWDWVSGVRGKLGGETGPFVPYYFDAGTGTSAFTWQGILGVGYAPNKYWDLRLVYRHLAYNEPAGTGVVQQLRLSGPAIGASFRF